MIIAQVVDQLTNLGFDARENETWWWWLRSPGYSSDYAAYVRNGGTVSTEGEGVDYEAMGVRPALYINLIP
jgi:hypothetical protein